MPELLIVCGLMFVALSFDYLNGFHDAANSIATIVSTRVLTPGRAVIWAAFFNFVAAFGFGTAVARTIGSGMVDITIVSFAVIFAGLFGAIVWDLITWYAGLPTSSSHALIGGYAGAAIAKSGYSAILPSGWTLTLEFIVLAPLVGMILGATLMTSIYWMMQRVPPGRVDQLFRRLQLVSVTAPTMRRRRWALWRGCCLRPVISRPSTFRSGSFLWRTRRSRSARSREGGASCTRWDRRSPS